MDHLDFLVVDFYSLFQYDKSQTFRRRYAKNKFLMVQSHPRPLDFVKCFPYVCQEIVHLFGFQYEVVDTDFHVPIYLDSKNIVDHLLKFYIGIL